MVTIRCFDRTFDLIEAVVFDKDGTLANSETLLYQLGWQRVRLLEAEVPGVQQRLLDCFGLSNHQVHPAGLLAVGTRQETEIAAAACLAATGLGWIESLGIVHTTFAQAAQAFTPKASYTPLCRGVLNLIQKLARADVKLAVLSSDTLDQIQAFVQTYVLESYFPVLVGATPELVKPNPALLLHTCRLLQVDPLRTLVIGDSRADTDMALAAGMAGVVGVTWGWSQLPRITNADVLVSDPDQIRVL